MDPSKPDAPKVIHGNSVNFIGQANEIYHFRFAREFELTLEEVTVGDTTENYTVITLGPATRRELALFLHDVHELVTPAHGLQAHYAEYITMAVEGPPPPKANGMTSIGVLFGSFDLRVLHSNVTQLIPRFAFSFEPLMEVETEIVPEIVSPNLGPLDGDVNVSYRFEPLTPNP